MPYISVRQWRKNGRMQIVENDQLHIKMCRKTMSQFLYLKGEFQLQAVTIVGNLINAKMSVISQI